MSRLVSMTGYGRGTHLGSSYMVEIELRSVNHRFREIIVRSRRELPAVTEKIRTEIASHVDRGRVDVLLKLSPLPGRRSLQVDSDLAISYYRALEDLRQQLGLDGDGAAVPLSLIAGLPGVVNLDDDADPEQYWQDIAPALAAAIEELLAMRVAEGANLAAALAQSLSRLKQLLDAVAGRAELVPAEYRERLAERLAQLASESAPVSEESLAAEVVMFAARSDISEEIVRLRSHIDQFAAALQSGTPIGRKLDFLLQEMARETNTIAAKAHDRQIGIAVVDMKTEIERMREQVQNVQ